MRKRRKLQSVYPNTIGVKFLVTFITLLNPTNLVLVNCFSTRTVSSSPSRYHFLNRNGMLRIGGGLGKVERTIHFPLQKTALYMKEFKISQTSDPATLNISKNDENRSSESSSESRTDENKGVDNDDSAFHLLSFQLVTCLLKSDLKRDSAMDGAATGWTSWVDEASALALQSCFNSMIFTSKPDNFLLGDLGSYDDSSDPLVSSGNDRQTALQQQNDVKDRWIRWIKATPAPLVIDMSTRLRSLCNGYLYNEDLNRVKTTREEFLSRLGARLILLPSGGELKQPFRTPAGGMFLKVCFIICLV